MSKKERNWKLFIMEILESINKIEKYIEGLNYEQFVRDEKTKDEVVRNLIYFQSLLHQSLKK